MAFGSMWSAALAAVANKQSIGGRANNNTEIASGTDNAVGTTTTQSNTEIASGTDNAMGTTTTTRSNTEIAYGTDNAVGTTTTRVKTTASKKTLKSSRDNVDTSGSRVTTRGGRRYNPDIHGSSSKYVPANSGCKDTKEVVPKDPQDGDKKKRGHMRKVNMGDATQEDLQDGEKRKRVREQKVNNDLVSCNARKTVLKKVNKGNSKITIDYRKITSSLAKLTKEIMAIKKFTKEIGVIRDGVYRILDIFQDVQDNLQEENGTMESGDGEESEDDRDEESIDEEEKSNEDRPMKKRGKQ
jgi:hypothetical protein